MNSTPICKNLRSKKTYIPALAGDLAENPELHPPGASHCWCNCTLTETGPDDRPVGPAICRPGRPCFEE